MLILSFTFHNADIVWCLVVFGPPIMCRLLKYLVDYECTTECFLHAFKKNFATLLILFAFELNSLGNGMKDTLVFCDHKYGTKLAVKMTNYVVVWLWLSVCVLGILPLICYWTGIDCWVSYTYPSYITASDSSSFFNLSFGEFVTFLWSCT